VESSPATEGATRPRSVTIEGRAARKVIAGHPWLYANEVVRRDPELAEVDLVVVHDPDGRPLATGTYFKHSLIQIRIFTRRDEPVDATLIARRLTAALERRRRVYPDLQCLRLVHGESDGLPGLVADLYKDVVVLELNTQGVFLVLDAILDGLEALLAPRAIVLRNTASTLAYEQLEPRTEVLRGRLDGPVEVQEWGVKYRVDPTTGQKTGLFLDQKENRRLLRQWCEGRVVWDVFAYAGGWGLNALAAGARHVTFVDSSATACEQIRQNLALNGFENATVVQASGFDALRDMPPGAVEVLVLDPPAFAKAKKDLPAATRAYIDINRVGLQRLVEGGVLATSTCSYHVSSETFDEIIRRAAFQARQRVELLAEGGQAADHPCHVEFPESRYLKTRFLRKLPYHP
jgi:23S rRNA (cytosine1962-C5)-methyltransferase